MNSAEIREKFLKFFEVQGHQRVKSSSLIPAADPSLLFTNAGMVQFKDVFLGLHNPGYRRATTAQKCVRAGGKHNDLENVGFTPRHHTFFEMLGNFSFGDYFKKEAIAYAWELLTVHYRIPKEKLRITVYEKDDEAMELWKAQGIRPDWIYRLGEKDNFWAMGDTGPCGPCTEIHFDWGPQYGCGKPDCNPGCPCGLRFLEIWNLVFMQFNRSSDGTMTPLPKPSVDTGAGLERLASVLQGTYSNYDSDSFTPILQAISRQVDQSYGENETDNVSMRVIADHIRSGTFLMADGVIPSNEGRGYVLRRILRRAIRHGKKLGQDKPFLYQLVGAVVTSLGDVYPEIRTSQKLVESLMQEEEIRFHETLHRGLGLLEDTIAKVRSKKEQKLPGDVAFKLYDTFGFPLDLIEVICREQNLEVDTAAFDKLMGAQREKSTWKGAEDSSLLEPITKAIEKHQWATQFYGYAKLRLSAEALKLFAISGSEAASLKQGEQGIVIFRETPFYAESGGQMGDKGEIIGLGVKAKVLSTFKIGKAFLHRVEVEAGQLKEGATYELSVDTLARQLTAINHTATHLLHAALRKVLGDRVKQAGSLVEPSRLRFDFTFPRALSDDEIRQVEMLVNDQVQRNLPVAAREMAFDEALKTGALAFFDEKYGDRVRVISVGGEAPVSIELCGGTHLSQTADIGMLKITTETSVASGVRRIEAITSGTAFEYLANRSRQLEAIERKLAAKAEVALQKIEQLQKEIRELQRENEKLQIQAARGGTSGGSGGALWEKHVMVKDYKIVTDHLPTTSAKVLRSLVDQVRDKLKEKTLVLLASESEGKVMLCLGLTSDLTSRWNASKIIQALASEVNGTGGGRADFAQAGGTDASGLPKAFSKLKQWVEQNA